MKQKSMSQLEQQVMNIIWQKKQCTVRDIVNELKKERELAYTTVGTILERLLKKSMVRRKAEGVTFIYKPKVTKESYTKTLANSFLNTFIHSFGDAGLVSFAESVEKLPEKKRKYLLTLLQKHDKSK